MPKVGTYWRGSLTRGKKRCTKCGKIKPKTQFYVRRTTYKNRTYLAPHCKACDHRRSVAWQRKHGWPKYGR